MTRAVILITLALLLQMCSDNNSFNERSDQLGTQPKLATGNSTTNQSVLTNDLETRPKVIIKAKLIKTANIKMKVKSVKDQAQLKENIVIQHGGYISTADLGADIKLNTDRNAGCAVLCFIRPLK